MPQFNPKRLELARRRRGFTKAALAEAASVSTRIVTAYERSEKEPGERTLVKLSEILDFPIGFFSGPDLDEPPLDGSSFRALSTLTARLRDQTLGSGAIALSFSDWLEKRFALPEPTVPTFGDVDPETAAQMLRREWCLDDAPVVNMVHLLELHGVRVFSLAEECLDVDAFSFWRGSVPYVFLNSMKSGERSRMDAAHELGHLVMHRQGGVQGRSNEQTANLFGSSFLMPRNTIYAFTPRDGQLDSLIKAKRHWNVSISGLVYRMHAVDVLSDWQYRSLFIEMSQRGYRSQEPNSSPPEKSQVLEKVFRALAEDGVTKSAIATELAISTQELDKVVFGLM